MPHSLILRCAGLRSRSVSYYGVERHRGLKVMFQSFSQAPHDVIPRPHSIGLLGVHFLKHHVVGQRAF